MTTISTETGSTYEFDPDYTQVRRVEHSHDLRRDGEWLQIRTMKDPEVGFPLLMLLEPLGDTETTNCTIRVTSAVIAIEGAE